ncbi:hypothetical protein CAPTEDRAFT_225057 [Capitella teleta]|uniref:Major facilitator superfamily (MFS) profile domain-containing protein n=1 Tax=Capitella teleta TaxID=283909 RepID=R7UMX1_CAPTE|nr:hypothetical protein CAPTEDRAFT_225057 [Capitella teleta]|eukprot:ELU07889.1 hypothetical protein CAPTEDRAFT_225057 [Capitella teleta]
MENKVMTSQEEIKHVTSPEDVKIVDLFKDGVLLRHCCVSSLLWFGTESPRAFTNFLVYFFLILSSPSFAGGRFLNYYLGGLVEIPAYIFAFLVCKKLGRRLPVVVLHCMVALALVVVIVLHFVNMSVAAEVPLVLTSTLIGKMAITASFAIILPYTKELVPTNIRGISGGLFVILGQMGAMAAPLLAFVMKTEMRWIPLAGCAGLALASGLLSMLLPDTFNKPLPQTLQDVHDLYPPPKITSATTRMDKKSAN